MLKLIMTQGKQPGRQVLSSEKYSSPVGARWHSPRGPGMEEAATEEFKCSAQPSCGEPSERSAQGFMVG